MFRKSDRSAGQKAETKCVFCGKAWAPGQPRWAGAPDGEIWHYECAIRAGHINPVTRDDTGLMTRARGTATSLWSVGASLSF
jgi:hypothetical protein